MKYLINKEIDFSRSQVGGKALNLSLLSKIPGVRVPEWTCLTTEAFIKHLVHANIDLDKMVPESEIQHKILSTELSLELREEIISTLQREVISFPLAVRSSSSIEDSKTQSCAGLYDSFLNIKDHNELFEAIKKVWASTFSPHACDQYIRTQIPVNSIQMAVIIQELIDGDVAGVCFTRDPRGGDSISKSLISSVFGLGEGLVSGELDADEFSVSRDDQSIEGKIAEKKHHFISRQTGCEKRLLPPELSLQESLSNKLILKIHKLGLAIESHFGCPQDIEWCIKGGIIYTVQARPVTSLPQSNKAFVSRNTNSPIIWDNSNIVESFEGTVLPLTFSHVQVAYKEVYKSFARVLGVSQKKIEQLDSLFGQMLGIYQGRIYYNLLNWYKLIHLFPNAKNSSEFMEAMMGVNKSLGETFSDSYKEELKKVTPTAAQKVKLSLATVYRFFFIDKINQKFIHRIESFYKKYIDSPFDSWDMRKKFGFYKSSNYEILRDWNAPIINDTRCMIFFGLLSKLGKNWLTGIENPESAINGLLAHQGGVFSMEPTVRLIEIAEQIDSGWMPGRDWIMDGPYQNQWDQLEENKDLAKLHHILEEYIRDYGCRMANELKLETISLEEDPSSIFVNLKSFIESKSWNKKNHEVEDEIQQEIKRSLNWPRKLLFNWVLKSAKSAIRDREKLRFLRTQTFHLIRKIFISIGKDLNDLGLIKDHRDVFYLTTDEIGDFTTGSAVSNRLDLIIEARKKEYGEYQRIADPENRFVTYGSVGLNINYPALRLSDQKEAPIGDYDLSGTPCCPGEVIGEVHVARTYEEAMDIKDKILVCNRTDPGWVPLFPKCKALIVERGSLLSHSAVVAREMGIPTIVGAQNATSILKHGAIIAMDGKTGEIKVTG